jgi:hypothetical protein
VVFTLHSALTGTYSLPIFFPCELVEMSLLLRAESATNQESYATLYDANSTTAIAKVGRNSLSSVYDNGYKRFSPAITLVQGIYRVTISKGSGVSYSSIRFGFSTKHTKR